MLPEAPRTLLFVPADRTDELLPKALVSGADALVIDLEDAVPADGKAQARRLLAGATRAPGGPHVFVRTEHVSDDGFLDDVEAAAAFHASGLVLPKVANADEVVAADAVWRSAVQTSTGPCWLIALIETPLGVLNAHEIAGASPSVVGLGLGGEDLRAAIGVAGTPSGIELAHARGLIVLAAAAEGRWAFDSVSVELRDADVIRDDARRARDLGFVGKFVIHPSQIRPVHAALRPTPEELDHANQVLTAFEHAKGAGKAVAELNGRLIDAPVVSAAQTVIARANRP